MPTPNYELLAAPATWDDDILCGLDFSPTPPPPPPPPPFDPTQYLYYRWVGTREFISTNGFIYVVDPIGPTNVAATTTPGRWKCDFNAIDHGSMEIVGSSFGAQPNWKTNFELRWSVPPPPTLQRANIGGIRLESSAGSLLISLGSYYGDNSISMTVFKGYGTWQFSNDFNFGTIDATWAGT